MQEGKVGCQRGSLVGGRERGRGTSPTTPGDRGRWRWACTRTGTRSSAAGAGTALSSSQFPAFPQRFCFPFDDARDNYPEIKE